VPARLNENILVDEAIIFEIMQGTGTSIQKYKYFSK
jgi:hypothetical protein